MPANLKPGQQWLRNKQLADWLGVTTMCLYRWLHNPELGCPQPNEINGTAFHDIAMWESWIRSRGIGSAAASAARTARVERLRGKEVIAADRAARSKSKAGSRAKA